VGQYNGKDTHQQEKTDNIHIACFAFGYTKKGRFYQQANELRTAANRKKNRNEKRPASDF
jgi:hypothetical protein